jgi:hypothetical protein
VDATWHTAAPAVPYSLRAVLCLHYISAAAFQFISFLHVFPYSDLRVFIAFLCSINGRRFPSVYWTEIGNFNDNESSEDWCGVVSCKLSILKTRGAQVTGD